MRLFHRDGATIVAHDNIRLRLAAGTTNANTGNKTPPMEADAIPTDTYMVGGMKVEAGGRVRAGQPCDQRPHRRRQLGLFSSTPTSSRSATPTAAEPIQPRLGLRRHHRRMVLALERYLKAANDTTKIVPGHGPLATKGQPSGMARHDGHGARPGQKTVRRRKSEQEVLAANPLADLDGKWGRPPRDHHLHPTFLRNVYNSFRNRN